MKSTHNKLEVAAITGTMTQCDRLEQADARMRVPAFPRIDQTARNGP